jgi:hypothetical protein
MSFVAGGLAPWRRTSFVRTWLLFGLMVNFTLLICHDNVHAIPKTPASMKP